MTARPPILDTDPMYDLCAQPGCGLERHLHTTTGEKGRLGACRQFQPRP